MILRGLAVFALLVLFAFFGFFWAHEERLTWFDARPVLAAAAKYDATIHRDRFGVPHIEGPRDADAAFGLGFAHAEDDFATIQRAFLEARGRLATLDGLRAAQSDYLVQLLGIWDVIAAKYRTDLSDETRALLDGYAAGVNLYAAQHRGQVLPGFEPVRGEDVVALFMLRLPFFYGLDDQLRALLAGGVDKIAPDLSRNRSLAVAVAPSRSADGATRLLVSPQGPFGGQLSWYEAQVTSGEGWNIAGGTIPGSPVMLAGAGPNFGWGISPNHPDLADVYALEPNPNDRYFYRYNDDWQRLQAREARLVVRVWGPIRITYRREILKSLHGPVIRNAHGLFAVHYAGQDDLKGVEAFFRLNKAKDLDGFTAAVSGGGIPSLSFVYADGTGRIASLYNGEFPGRPGGFDWTRAVPGNTEDDLWDSYLPAANMPKTVAPGSGFVIATGATPFRTTADPFNPKPDDFAPTQGIETGLNNRARRALVLLSAGRTLTAEQFRAVKFDVCYTADSDFALLVKGLSQRNFSGDPLLEEAGEDLRRYDLCTNQSSRGAALAVLTAVPLLDAAARRQPQPDPVATLRTTANRLLRLYGRLDPAWGQIVRLRRGTQDLPLSGGPDTMRSIDVQPSLDRNGTQAARGGDALTLISTWTRDGRWQVESVVPFGSSNVAGAPHYADQAPLFATGKLKPVPLTPAAVAAETTQIERPGKPPQKPGTVPPAQPQPPSISAPASAAERTLPPSTVTR